MQSTLGPAAELRAAVARPGRWSCRPREGSAGAASGMSWVGWTQAAPQVRGNGMVPGWGLALGAAEVVLHPGRVGGLVSPPCAVVADEGTGAPDAVPHLSPSISTRTGHSLLPVHPACRVTRRLGPALLPMCIQLLPR